MKAIFFNYILSLLHLSEFNISCIFFSFFFQSHSIYLPNILFSFIVIHIQTQIFSGFALWINSRDSSLNHVFRDVSIYVFEYLFAVPDVISLIYHIYTLAYTISIGW